MFGELKVQLRNESTNIRPVKNWLNAEQGLELHDGSLQLAATRCFFIEAKVAIQR